MRPGGRAGPRPRVVVILGLGVLVVVGLLVLAMRDRMVEAWLLHRLGSDDEKTREKALEELSLRPTVTMLPRIVELLARWTTVEENRGRVYRPWPAGVADRCAKLVISRGRAAAHPLGRVLRERGTEEATVALSLLYEIGPVASPAAPEVERLLIHPDVSLAEQAGETLAAVAWAEDGVAERIFERWERERDSRGEAARPVWVATAYMVAFAARWHRLATCGYEDAQVRIDEAFDVPPDRVIRRTEAVLEAILPSIARSVPPAGKTPEAEDQPAQALRLLLGLSSAHLRLCRDGGLDRSLARILQAGLLDAYRVGSPDSRRQIAEVWAVFILSSSAGGNPDPDGAVKIPLGPRLSAKAPSGALAAREFLESMPEPEVALLAADLIGDGAWGDAKAKDWLERLVLAVGARAIPVVAELTRDERPGVRIEALKLLPRFEVRSGADREAAREPIVAALGDPEPRVRLAAGESLGAMGAFDAPTLDRLLAAFLDARTGLILEDDGALRRGAASLIGNVAISLREDPGCSPRIDALRAEALETLRSGSPERRRGAAALLHAWPGAGDEALLAALDDPDPRVQAEAMAAAGSVGWSIRRVFNGRILRVLARTEDEALRRTAVEVLDRQAFARGTEMFARTGLADPDPAVRADAARALGALGTVRPLSEETVEDLRWRALGRGEEDLSVRKALVEALDRIEDGPEPEGGRSR